MLNNYSGYPRKIASCGPLFLFLFILFFIHEREREAETQSEGEAGSTQEPDVGLDPGSPG